MFKCFPQMCCAARALSKLYVTPKAQAQLSSRRHPFRRPNRAPTVSSPLSVRENPTFAAPAAAEEATQPFLRFENPRSPTPSHSLFPGYPTPASPSPFIWNLDVFFFFFASGNLDVLGADVSEADLRERAGIGAVRDPFACSSPPDSPRSFSEATNSRVSAPNPPPMPDAARRRRRKLEAAREVVTLALSELSRHDISSSTSPPCADLPALFRRCFLSLPLLNAGDPSLAAECCRGLLASLGAILSGDPSPSLLPSLEVFADSLVSNGKLRSCLALADCAAREGSRIFTRALPCQGDHHLVLELACRHFISSLEDEGEFEVFWSALSWSGNKSRGTPEISFQGALALTHMTCLFPLPTVIQAHLLLLVSRCIGDQNLDLHLLTFEHAMNLYVRYLPALHIFNRTGGVKTSQSRFVKEIPLRCCITDAADQKLRSQINRLLLFCQLHSGDDLPTNESDIDRLIEEHQDILHEKFREESSMVVKNILLNILHCAKQKDVHESDTGVSDEIICLAAILRVMSSSLLYILHCVSQMASAGDKENVDYVTLCKGYNFLYESIHLLGQNEANGLHTYDLLDIIGMPVDRERASMLMLAHFATMSLYCVRKRLGFLWKGCIVMMIMSMNLIAEEEGPGTFELSSKESAIVCSTEEGILKVSARVKAMALRYEAIHKIHKGRHIDGDGSRLGTPQKCLSIIGKADGQAFLECHPEYSPDWSDLVDFVECEEGKDYSNTLKQHQKFRKFKYEKKWSRKRQSKMEWYLT